jgi:hypothetical protein
MSTQPVPTDLSPQHRQLIVRRILFCPAEERTARELHSLDTSEREQVWADMTGYAPTVHYRMHEAESTPLLEDRMAKWKEQERTILLTDEEVGRQEMNPPLSKAAVSFSGIDGRVAYRMACIQDPEWVEKQKLKFLRSENFDATLAVQRMMRYLALKSYLFCVGGNTTNSSGRGDDVLGRDVRLSDLNTDDLEALKSGGVQFLSEYDAAGRGVIFTKARKYKDRKNLVRRSLVFKEFQPTTIGRDGSAWILVVKENSVASHSRFLISQSPRYSYPRTIRVVFMLAMLFITLIW